MTKEEAKKMGATHYFLVPKGSGDPYYLFQKMVSIISFTRKMSLRLTI